MALFGKDRERSDRPKGPGLETGATGPDPAPREVEMFERERAQLQPEASGSGTSAFLGRGSRVTGKLAFEGPVALPPEGVYAVRVAWRRDDGAWRARGDEAGSAAHGHGAGEAAGAQRPSRGVAGSAAPPSEGAGWRSGAGVASLGRRPTFGAGEQVLEVHVFGLAEDDTLYGTTMRVEFVRRQRGERRFASPAELVRQMERDVRRARRILGDSDV